MPSNPWRYRCPEGHAALRVDVDRVYCCSCKQSYDWDDIADLAGHSPVEVRDDD